jgi:hypothetical protein
MRSGSDGTNASHCAQFSHLFALRKKNYRQDERLFLRGISGGKFELGTRQDRPQELWDGDTLRVFAEQSKRLQRASRPTASTPPQAANANANGNKKPTEGGVKHGA